MSGTFVISNSNVLQGDNYKLDFSTPGAFKDIIEHQWDFNIYSVEQEVFMFASAADVLDFTVKAVPNSRYRVFNGNYAVVWNNDTMITFQHDFAISFKKTRPRFSSDINVSGRRENVEIFVKEFYDHFKDLIREDHQNVQLAMIGQHGIEYADLPIKSEQEFFPLMYPSLKPDPISYIDNYLNSNASVLILIGEAGMGKSALINQMILTAKKRTHVIYDKEVMKMDQVYTDFINRSLQNNGGLMILEDADTVLSDRIVSQNSTMSKLLNLSDGIIDTSKAKFIFSANIKNKDDIDVALTRPGRCFDILDFPPLTKKEAQIAAESVGKTLPFEKDSYTVAEIFNGKSNHYDRKQKVGFI